MSACNCCEEPPCPAPILSSRSVSVTKGQCGWLRSDGQVYMKRVDHFTTWPFSFPGASETITYTPDTTPTGGSCSMEDESVPGVGFMGCPVYCIKTNSTTNDTCDCNGGGTGYVHEYEYSSVYTVDELIANTLASLPDFADAVDGGWSYRSDLSSYGGLKSLSIRKAKWKLSHLPTGTCYLKVWLQTRFSPIGGGDDVITGLDPYEWFGSGSPCIEDPTLPVNDDAQIITSDEHDLDIPESSGTLSVEIVKYSCVEGYEPEDGSTSGFPTIYGCTDWYALNYNPDATADDGSCIYPEGW